MDKYYDILKNTKLFKNISLKEYKDIFSVLNPYTKSYKEDSIIFYPGQLISSIGILLEGSVQVFKDDYWGNRNILTDLSIGDVFGEVYVFTQEPLGITVKANENSLILFINFKKILDDNVLNKSNIQLVTNFLQEFAYKNLLLTKKIDVISKKSIRDKIMTYLTSQAINANSNTFTIPYNRQELADFLCTDRSALSNELSKLQKLNYIDFKKNQFTLKKKDELL